jgi:hypothetical protein
MTSTRALAAPFADDVKAKRIASFLQRSQLISA